MKFLMDEYVASLMKQNFEIKIKENHHTKREQFVLYVMKMENAI